jgi:hypothetical protein
MKGKRMVDLATGDFAAVGWATAELASRADIELKNARVARLNAELACCEIEELAEAVRRDHLAFVRLTCDLRWFQPLRSVPAAKHNTARGAPFWEAIAVSQPIEALPA